MKMKRAIAFFLLVVFATLTNAYCQTEPIDDVHSVACDGDVIWCGTANGLIKWNKVTHEFARYSQEDGLPDYYTNVVKIDTNGVVWCGTRNGVGYQHGNGWSSFPNDTIDGKWVRDMAIGTDNTKWIATKNGIWKFDGSWYAFSETDSLPPWDFSSITTGPNGTIWATCWDLYYFDGQKWNINIDCTGNNNINHIRGDGQENLWMIRYGGMGAYYPNQLDGMGWKEYYPPGELYFRYGTIKFTNIAFENGLIWFTADAHTTDFLPTGEKDNYFPLVLSFDGQTWAYQECPLDPETYFHFNDLAFDQDGIAWIASNKGLIEYNGDSFVQHAFPDQTGVQESFPESNLPVTSFPNPFNSSTTISFTIPKQEKVSLAIYSITGQKVATLVDGTMTAGSHSVLFDGSNLGSGMYFYRFESPGFAQSGKMLMIK